jgi:dCMP deaminase
VENRLSWNEYFLKMAEITSLRSPCLSNKKGCVIVKENRVLGTGYNGPPSGLPHCEWRDDHGEYKIHYDVDLKEFYPIGDFQPINSCPRQRIGFTSGQGLEHCPAIHAEINAIIMSRTDIRNSFLYCSFTEIPCRECSKLIINAEITKIILNGQPKEYPQPGITGKQLLELAKIEVVNGKSY